MAKLMRKDSNRPLERPPTANSDRSMLIVRLPLKPSAKYSVLFGPTTPYPTSSARVDSSRIAALGEDTPEAMLSKVTAAHRRPKPSDRRRKT
jgi:hypothetical protein